MLTYHTKAERGYILLARFRCVCSQLKPLETRPCVVPCPSQADVPAIALMSDFSTCSGVCGGSNMATRSLTCYNSSTADGLGDFAPLPLPDWIDATTTALFSVCPLPMYTPPVLSVVCNREPCQVSFSVSLACCVDVSLTLRVPVGIRFVLIAAIFFG